MQGLTFDIGVGLLSEYDADGFIGIQVDNYGEGQSGVQPYELHSVHGLYSRMNDPDTDGAGNATKGCTVLYGMEGGRGHAWLCSDPRAIVNIPQVQKGGVVLYGGPNATPSFFNVDGKTGSITLYVPYEISGGTPAKSMSIEINVDVPGQESITIVHGSGMAVTMRQGSLILKNASGSAYLELNDGGGVLNGNWAVAGSLATGAVAAALPVASAISTVAAIAALEAQVAAISAALTAIFTPPPAITGAIALPLWTPAISAVAAGAAVVVASSLTVPMLNTKGT